MGNSKQQPTERKRIGRKAANKPTAESGTPHKRGPRAGRGGERLRSALNKLVDEQSEQIAQALINKTIAGNMVGARLLSDLTGAKNPRIKPTRKKRGLSEAEELASEQTWVGPDYDGDCTSLHPLETAV
jgi:hypothetical protein